MGENLNNISKFKFWCHKILPLVYDDSLSYYEFLCKVVAKLNEVIELSEQQNGIITEFGNEIERWETSTDGKYAEFVEKVEDLIDAFEATIVEKFRVNESYEQGEYVAHEGNMYKAKVNVSGGEWNPNEWEQVVYTVDLLARVKAFEVYLDNKRLDFENTIIGNYEEGKSYKAGDYVVYNGKVYKAKNDVSGGVWNENYWEETVYANDLYSRVVSLDNEMRNQYEDFLDRYLETIGISRDTGLNDDVAVAQRTVSVSFANAIKGEESGGAVLCEDVSPVLHPVEVGVMSGNLIQYPYDETTKTGNGITFTDNGDGSITVNGTCTDSISFSFGSFAVTPNQDYFIKVIPVSGGFYSIYAYIYTDSNDETYDFGNGGRFTPNGDSAICAMVIVKGQTFDNLIVKPMLNKGTTAEPYTPFVPDGTAVKVTRCGSNLFKAELGGDGYILSGYGSSLEAVNTNTISYKPEAGEGQDYIRFAQKYHSGDYTLGSKGKSPRQLFWLFDNLGNNISSQYASKFDAVYNDFYDGFFYDGEKINITVPNDVSFWRYGVFFQPENNNLVTISEIQVSMGKDTPYEPYEGQTIDTTVGSTIDLPSIAPYMSVYTNTEGTAVDVNYTKDTNKVIQNLVNAIISLGGTI